MMHTKGRIVARNIATVKRTCTTINTLYTDRKRVLLFLHNDKITYTTLKSSIPTNQYLYTGCANEETLRSYLTNYHALVLIRNFILKQSSM
jgi:hypothetical protein